MTQCSILLITSCMNLCLVTLNIKATKHLWGEVMIYCRYMRAIGLWSSKEQLA